MKKLILLALLLTACDTKGAGVVNTNIIQVGTGSTWMITYSWTGDASTGSVPTTAASGGSSSTQQLLLTAMQGASVISVETAPGSPAPTNGYAVAITDNSGADVLGGAAATTSSTVAQSWSPALSAAPLNGSLSLAITGQSVASAKGTVYVFLTKSTTSASAKSSSALCRVIGSQTANYFLKALNGTNDCSWAAGAGGTPAGSNTQLQYNNSGAFGAITGATTNGTALTLVAPVLGTPASATLTNATGLPISTGVSGLATGIATFLTTPTSANLLATMTTKTGTGLAVFNDTPTFISPILGNASATSLTIAGGPTCTPGTGGAECIAEGTAPSVGPASGVDVCYSDSTLHAQTCSYNNGSYFPLGRIIAHGSKALDFTSTATGACATVITDTATGAVSTDVVLFNANASIKAVTGYVPASTGGFSVAAFPSADLVSFEACNWTAGTVDPGSITVNWMVIRI